MNASAEPGRCRLKGSEGGLLEEHSEFPVLRNLVVVAKPADPKREGLVY